MTGYIVTQFELTTETIFESYNKNHERARTL